MQAYIRVYHRVGDKWEEVTVLDCVEDPILPKRGDKYQVPNRGASTVQDIVHQYVHRPLDHGGWYDWITIYLDKG